MTKLIKKFKIKIYKKKYKNYLKFKIKIIKK